MAGALIVTAELGAEELAWLDSLRRRHYPPERNQLPAHLTMFHALPPSAEGEARARLAACATERPPQAMIAGVMDLGGGVAMRVVSDDLDRIRDAIARDLHGLLSAQDSAGWRPHVTIQNKVPPRTARVLFDKMAADFRPRPLPIRGLALHRYLGGPWQLLGSYAFRGR